MWGCLVGLILVLSSVTARADDDDKEIGVIVVAPHALETDVSIHVDKWLRSHHYRLVAAAMSRDAENTFANCLVLDDPKCSRGVFEARVKPGRLVYVRVEVDSDTYTIDIYWFSKGHDGLHVPARCDKCDSEGWQRVVDDTLATLSASSEVPKVEEIKEMPPPPPPSKPSSRLWPALLLGAGVATMAAGGVFLYYGTRDDASQKYVYPDATPAGITLLAVGGAAAIGGTILLIQAGSSPSGPVVAAGRDSGYLGWVGRF